MSYLGLTPSEYSSGERRRQGGITKAGNTPRPARQLSARGKHAIQVVVGRCPRDGGFMLLGELVEFEITRELFTNPRDKRTEDYITGRFG